MHRLAKRKREETWQTTSTCTKRTTHPQLFYTCQSANMEDWAKVRSFCHRFG